MGGVVVGGGGVVGVEMGVVVEVEKTVEVGEEKLLATVVV